jgi:hypothetical protein
VFPCKRILRITSFNSCLSTELLELWKSPTEAWNSPILAELDVCYSVSMTSRTRFVDGHPHFFTSATDQHWSAALCDNFWVERGVSPSICLPAELNSSHFKPLCNIGMFIQSTDPSGRFSLTSKCWSGLAGQSMRLSTSWPGTCPLVVWETMEKWSDVCHIWWHKTKYLIQYTNRFLFALILW